MHARITDLEPGDGKRARRVHSRLDLALLRIEPQHLVDEERVARVEERSDEPLNLFRRRSAHVGRSASVASRGDGESATDSFHLLVAHAADELAKLGLPHREEVREVHARLRFQAFIDVELDLRRRPPKRRRHGGYGRRVEHLEKRRTCEDQHRPTLIRRRKAELPDLAPSYSSGHAWFPRRLSTSRSIASPRPPYAGRI